MKWSGGSLPEGPTLAQLVVIGHYHWVVSGSAGADDSCSGREMVMAFQFIHMEAFSRKGDSKGRSTSFVMAEARRDPVASVHVANPSPPIVVYGSTINEVETMHDAAAAVATTAVKGGKPRKLRQDQKTLHTVLSRICVGARTVSKSAAITKKRSALPLRSTAVTARPLPMSPPLKASRAKMFRTLS